MNSAELNIYTTVSGWRTHIAYGEKYVGNINSYNNFFTKFFAWLFQLSTSVNFDGKDRSVNKKSYAKLLGKLKVADSNDLNRYIVFKQAVNWDKVELKDKDYMRDHLSDSKKQKLFKKLAIAISTDMIAKALKMIRKGASLDQRYFDRSSFGPSFHSPEEGLKSEGHYGFPIFYAPPILQAANKSTTNKLSDEVVIELKKYGADLELSANLYNFSQNLGGTRSLAYEKRLKLNEELKLIPSEN